MGQKKQRGAAVLIDAETVRIRKEIVGIWKVPRLLLESGAG